MLRDGPKPEFDKRICLTFMLQQWLRCCATNRKVSGSIPDGVIGIFHRHNPSDRTTALESTQRLTERVPGEFTGCKSGRCLRLTTLQPSWAIVT